MTAPLLVWLLKDVEPEDLRDLAADLDAAHAVAVASSRGEKTPMPIWPGITAMIPPETPLFAGMPTS